MLFLLGSAISIDQLVVHPGHYTKTPPPSKTTSITINRMEVHRQDHLTQIFPRLSIPLKNTVKKKAREMEVAAFNLSGKHAREKLDIFDLDIIATSGGKRYFPLIRLLDALKLEWRKNVDNTVIFTPEGGRPVKINPLNNEVEINGITRQVELIVAVSDITMEEDIFLLPEIIADIFSFSMDWDDEYYAFVATTELSLHIWKRPEWVSLLGMNTEELLENLPEAHKAAYPTKKMASLDFVNLNAHAAYKPVDPNYQNSLSLDSIEQTFWGSLLNGRYKMRISEPNLRYMDNYLDDGEDPLFSMEWGEWRYLTDTSATVIGDSRFGLNDLAFSTVRMQGVRINGITGIDEKSRDNDRSDMGLRDVFTGSGAFEGYAPVGSRVELYINDILINSDDVNSSLPSMPGTGLYIFEDISLAPGVISDIRIVIIEPDGEETIIEKSILGSSELLPRGALAYLGALGTYRTARELETNGTFGAGRMLYGLTDTITAGFTMAYQKEFYDSINFFPSDSNERAYPANSTHGGVRLAWQILDNSLLSGELAMVQWEQGAEMEGNDTERLEPSDEKETLDDISYKLDWRLSPWKQINFQGLYFSYGPDYFDGVSRNLRDREGYIFNTEITPFLQWRFNAATGKAWNDLNDDSEERLSVNFQKVRLFTSIVPKTSLGFTINRIEPDWNEDTNTLYSTEFRSSLTSSLYFSGFYSAGDELRLDENDDFLEGLRLPGISRYATKKTSIKLTKRFSGAGNIGLEYQESGDKKRASVIHSIDSFTDYKIDIGTEAGFDFETESPYFENRIEMPLFNSRRSRLGTHTRLEDEEWEIEVYFHLNALFSFLGDGMPSYINMQGITPESKVVYGKVFLDRNGNTVLDPDEHGVDGVEILYNGRKSTETDKSGNFIIPTPGDSPKGTLSLQPESIPAIYACTHGRQKVYCKSGELNQVNFGLIPINSITGYVVSESRGKRDPLAGIRVYAKQVGSAKPAVESITGIDGSYYLEDIRPGTYTLKVDPGTVPNGLFWQKGQDELTIEPTDEPQEIKYGDIMLLPSN